MLWLRNIFISILLGGPYVVRSAQTTGSTLSLVSPRLESRIFTDFHDKLSVRRYKRYYYCGSDRSQGRQNYRMEWGETRCFCYFIRNAEILDWAQYQLHSPQLKHAPVESIGKVNASI